MKKRCELPLATSTREELGARINNGELQEIIEIEFPTVNGSAGRALRAAMQRKKLSIEFLQFLNRVVSV